MEEFARSNGDVYSPTNNGVELIKCNSNDSDTGGVLSTNVESSNTSVLQETSLELTTGDTVEDTVSVVDTESNKPTDSNGKLQRFSLCCNQNKNVITFTVIAIIFMSLYALYNERFMSVLNDIDAGTNYHYEVNSHVHTHNYPGW